MPRYRTFNPCLFRPLFNCSPRSISRQPPRTDIPPPPHQPLKDYYKNLHNSHYLNGKEYPIETRLVGNFPNPFNPETWIPYHLAHNADVLLTIYDTQGAVPVEEHEEGLLRGAREDSEEQIWTSEKLLG